MLKVVENWQNRDIACHFCLETRSVKYTVTVIDPTIKETPTEVYCCNKCALFHFGKEN